MFSKAFISHTESGGRTTGKNIYGKLRRPEVDMDTFLSNENIGPADDLMKSILENIVDTDFLILVLDYGALSSSWMEWEHDFCKLRNILPLYIVFPSMTSELNNLRYLDEYNIRIDYEDYDSDILLDKIVKTIISKRSELETQAEKRNAITITTNLSNTSCKPNDTVTINGNIQNTKNPNVSSFTSKIYLHIPGTTPKTPPESTTMANTITIDANGDFTHSLNLPDGPNADKIQKWYIEIRIDEKSELIPLDICPPNGVDSTGTSSAPSGGSFEGGGPSGIEPTVTTEFNFDDVKTKITSFSEGTKQSIPRKIRDTEIARNKEITQIISKLDFDDRIVITGDKGSGKSVLLCQLYEKLTQIYENVLFIRCDDFLGIDSISDLEKIVDENFTISKIVKNIPNNAKMIFLFDSLDAISRNTKSIGLFKQFLKSLWGTKRAQTVCSVRTYDYEYSPLISTTDWGFPVNLDELSDELLEKTLSELGNPTLPSSLKKILKNPLRLKLLSMILDRKNNADFSKITNEIELYNEHWKEYVETQENALETTKFLFDIAKKMVSEQKIILPYTMIDEDAIMFEAGSRDIIKTSNDQIQFFHHAYLDYVVSKLILQDYDSLVEYIKEDEYNVFLRPTIIFSLSLLNNINKGKYIKTIQEILESNLKYYWKISSLKSLAESNEFTKEELNVIGELLTSNLILQRHFLMEITKIVNPFWFKIWADSFLIVWYSKESGNGNFLVNYLKSLENYSEYHEQMISLIKSFVEKKERPLIKRDAIAATAKMIGVDKSKWYEDLSKNEESWVRSGVLSCLMDLLNTEPKEVPVIFKNIYTYNEPSNEQTQMMSYGTLGFTSTKNQDNRQVIWEAGELFPQLLEKNPKIMIKAVILIFEELKKEILEVADTDIVEDYNYIWYDESSFADIHDENKLIYSINEELGKIDEGAIPEFIPVLKSTKLAIFYKVLLQVLLRNPEKFKVDIYEIISHLNVLKINSLEFPVRNSINKICNLLSKSEISNLLQNIMGLEFPKKDFDEKKHLKLTNKIKAEFLKEFDKKLLSKEHLEILEGFTEKELVYKPPVSFSMSFDEQEDEKPTKPTSEEIIEQYLGKEVNHNQQIELLLAIIEYLGKKTEELEKGLLEKFKEYLIPLAISADPVESVKEKDSSIIVGYDTVRGLTARAIIRLFYHTRKKHQNPLMGLIYRLKTKDLKSLIVKLSLDKINLVRGEVARELPYLFYVDYPLTVEITRRYSKEPDNRVQFYLPEILRYLVNKHSKEAVEIIQNILTLETTRNYRHIQNLEYVILHLGLKKKDPYGIALLNKIIVDEKFATEVRRNIPFSLKENYLYDPEYQDVSLEIFLKLLDSKDHEVREGSAFFLLSSIKKQKTADIGNLIKKIHLHLDKIASEVEKKPWNPKTIEELIQFLENYWNYIPEKTLDYLEKITGVEEYSPYQPVFARGTVKILNGIFQLPFLKNKDRNRCLSVLDKFAMAGWPEALNLLSIMERPD